jgi:hypothetical protein
VAADHLLADAPGHVGDAEAAFLLGDGAVQEDLEEHVAELFLERLVGRPGAVEPPDGLDELVDLLDRVAGQALVRLLAVPRALVPQPAHDAVEADQLDADGLRHVGDVQAGEVVRDNVPVEVLPPDRPDLLVREAEALEHDDLIGAGAVDGELDVGEDPWRVRVGDQHRPPLAGRRGGELVPVDQAQAGLDRVDPEAPVGQVEEGEPRHDVHVDPGVGQQVAHAPLEHERRAGDRVDDLAVLLSSLDQQVGDALVDVGERVGPLVQVVEGSCIFNDNGRGMAGGAQEATDRSRQRVERSRGDEVGTSRAQPDDHHPRGRHRQCRETTLPAARLHLP